MSQGSNPERPSYSLSNYRSPLLRAVYPNESPLTLSFFGFRNTSTWANQQLRSPRRKEPSSTSEEHNGTPPEIAKLFQQSSESLELLIEEKKAQITLAESIISDEEKRVDTLKTLSLKFCQGSLVICFLTRYVTLLFEESNFFYMVFMFAFKWGFPICAVLSIVIYLSTWIRSEKKETAKIEKKNVSRQMPELVNIAANQKFYSPQDTFDDLRSARIFTLNSGIFTTRFRLTAANKNSLETMQENLRSLKPILGYALTSQAISMAATTLSKSAMMAEASESEGIMKSILRKPAVCCWSRPGNHAIALGTVLNWIRRGLSRRDLTEDHLHILNLTICGKCLSRVEYRYGGTKAPAGWIEERYRMERKMIYSNVEQVFPLQSEIPALMKSLLEYLKNSDDTDVEVLVNFHRWFMMIHPFYDANGQTARLICTFIALTAGFPGFLLNTVTKEEYEKALCVSQESPEVFGGLVVRELSTMMPVYKEAEPNNVWERLARWSNQLVSLM